MFSLNSIGPEFAGAPMRRLRSLLLANESRTGYVGLGNRQSISGVWPW